MFFNVLGYNRTLFQEYFERLLGYNVAKIWWPISGLRCGTLSDTSSSRFPLYRGRSPIYCGRSPIYCGSLPLRLLRPLFDLLRPLSALLRLL